MTIEKGNFDLNSKMGLVEELGNCTGSPVELLRSLVRLSLHVQLGLRDSSDILSYLPLIQFGREHSNEKAEIIIRTILQLFILSIRRYKQTEPIPNELIQLIYSLMSDPFPEVYALLVYSTSSLTPILKKSVLQFCSRRLRDSPEDLTVRTATLLLITCSIAKSVEKGKDIDLVVERFVERYLNSICFPLSSWERTIVQSCLDIDMVTGKQTPILSDTIPVTISQSNSNTCIFENIEHIYMETVAFLRLCYAVENGDTKAYGALDLFLQTVEHGKALGIFASIEVSQPVTWIINYMKNIARILAFQFGDSSKDALMRLIWLLLSAFPDYTDLIFTSFFSITNLRTYDAYISVKEVSYIKHSDVTDSDLQEALLRVVASHPAQILQRNIELVSLAFTTISNVGMPTTVPFYWELVPVNRRSTTSSQNLRTVVTRLLVANDTGIWIADWLKDTCDITIICGHIPLLFLQVSDKESFALLYESLCMSYQRQTRRLECDDGTVLTAILGYYDVFILSLSTLSVTEVKSIASSALIDNQALSSIMNLADLDSISLSYSLMDEALVSFCDLAYDRDVFKPVIEVTGQDGNQLHLEDADFLSELIMKIVLMLDDVGLIVSCVDDGEFYTTGVYRFAISCLYYFEILYAAITEQSGDSKVYVTRETRRLVTKALAVFKEANHSSIYYNIIKMKTVILRLLSMTSIISGLATMFVTVAPTAAIYLLIALFYSCTLLESTYSAGAASKLGVKISGNLHINDKILQSDTSKKASITLQSTIVYHLCTGKELYYTLFSSNGAIRGGILKIIIFELATIAKIQHIDSSFLSAIHTTKYRNIIRNSINMLVFEEKVIFTPWEKQLFERNLYSTSYTKQALNLYDADKAKAGADLAAIHELGHPFAGMCAKSQLTAIHYVYSNYSKSQLVDAMRSFVKDGISLAYSLQALGNHIAAIEFVLAEPVLRYGLLCAISKISRSTDSFNNNELLSLFSDSLASILGTNIKLAHTEKAAIDLLTLLQDFIYFLQRNYTPDGFTLTTAQMLRIYRTILMVCVENDLTAANSQAVKLCFVPNVTGLLALLPKVHVKLSSKAQVNELSEVFKIGVVSCCILDFLDTFILMQQIFQKSSNIHKGIRELANLTADLISRLILSIIRATVLHESDRPLIQTVVVRIESLLEEFIKPFSTAAEIHAIRRGVPDGYRSETHLRMVDYQDIGALSIGNLLSFIDCSAVIVTERHMQVYLCYVFSRLYQSFLQSQTLSLSDTELFYKAVLSTALYLQEGKRGFRGTEYFYINITVLLVHTCRITAERLNLLPRSDSDIPRATVLATNQILDGLLEQSLKFMADMREAEGTFNETYMLAEKSIILVPIIPSKAYIVCLLLLLQRKNLTAALKGSHIENIAQLLYTMYRRANSKTASIRQENRVSTYNPVDQYVFLADVLFCFIAGCEGGSMFISRFFFEQLDQQTQVHPDDLQPTLELNSYGYTLLLGLISKVPDVALWEVSAECPRTSKYIHRLIYVIYIIITKHIQYEHIKPVTKQRMVTVFLQTLMKNLASVFSVIKPKDIIDIQTQFMLLETLITIVSMYSLSASAYPSSLPPETCTFYIQLLDFINGLAALYYSTTAGTSLQNNEDGRMLLYASTLASTLMCPQLMTHAVMSKCNQFSNTIRQYIIRNKTLFGQTGIDVAMISFICLARNCIDDRNDLKGDIFPVIISQMCRGIFNL